ncbi:MAG TPA: hypothetical protein VF614_05660 [Chthoniobacteraceae bacterium]|jgi:carbon monoxide dehydrogenase subunit G
MLLQKTFHLHQSLDEARATLTDLQNVSDVLAGVRLAKVTAEGSLRLECALGRGILAQVEIASLPTDEQDQMLFRSVEGNMEVAGLVELFEVRPNCTEVQLTLDYTLKSSVHRFLDSTAGVVDRFVNRQLARLERQHAADEVERAPMRYRQTGFTPQLAH